MDKYYLIVDQSEKDRSSKQPSNQLIKNSPKIRKDVKIIYSPKTLKKNISNENFIKYQWAWTM